MTETVSDVYDLTYPSPISLKEISSIVIVVELWREEIRAHVASKRLQELNMATNIALKTALPSLPSTIYNLLEGYADKFKESIFSWQGYHCRSLFKHDGWMDILSRFDDFAWDWDGTIHEERTAKRMMLCDRLTQVEKFKIACMYCLEDDIKQIWPSVSETKELNEIHFQNCPEQYYWICYLRNELHKIPNPYNEPIDVLMVLGSREFDFSWRNRRNPHSVMYFWNRLPSGSQLPNHMLHMVHRRPKLFARFILPRLNEHQLDIFVAANGVDFMSSMLRSESNLAHVLPTWMYIRNRIDITHFSNLINKLLKAEVFLGEYFHSKNVANLFNEIWKSAPKHFKRSVLDDVLYRNDELFRIRNTISWGRGITLLILIFQDATFEERNVFWHKNWPKLIFSAPVEDLVVMMKLSFRNENEITLFKENIMSMYENIAEGCTLMLKHGLFNELNEFLSVCYLDEEKRELKRRLLRTNYIGDNSVFTDSVVNNSKLLNEFIEDAFQGGADLAVEFRNQLTSSPVTQNCLLGCIRNGYFDSLMEFVDIFCPDEQVRAPLKIRLFEHFKEHLIAGSMQYINGDKMNKFLSWVLGSDDEVIRFKQSISVEDIFRTLMRAERRVAAQVDGNNYKPVLPRKVDDFLMWYFNKDVEETEKFTKLFVDEFGSFFFERRRTA